MDAKPQVPANSDNRIIYLDLLRIISAFAVVMLHVSAQHWKDSFFSTEWMIRNVYDSCTRWCVPVFVMISGALFLDTKRELNVKRIYSKNVVHILFAFVVWSLIYVLVNINKDTKISYIVPDTIAGHFHLWFLKMLLGLYIIIPILKAITSNKTAEICFIFVAVITCFLLPLLFPAIGMISNGLRGMIEGWYNTMEIKIALGYTGYFVLGHFLNTYIVRTSIRNAVYVLGAFSISCVIVLTYLFSVRKGEPYGLFYGNLNIFTFFEATTIFLLIKQKSNNIPTKDHSSIIHFAKMSFGIYLVHPLVMFLFSKIGIDSSTFHPSFFIPCFSLIVFVVSYLITRILYNIPYLNKLVK